jgi:hypothetical protein
MDTKEGTLMTSKTGHCLCGKTRFAHDEEPQSLNHCHCESCRRATSSAFTTWFTVARESFRWTGEQPSRFESSTGVTRYFCKTCGSPMGYETTRRPEQIDLYAASLDDHNDFAPQNHVYWSERVAWIELADSLPKTD